MFNLSVYLFFAWPFFLYSRGVLLFESSWARLVNMAVRVLGRPIRSNIFRCFGFRFVLRAPRSHLSGRGTTKEDSGSRRKGEEGEGKEGKENKGRGRRGIDEKGKGDKRRREQRAGDDKYTIGEPHFCDFRESSRRQATRAANGRHFEH